MGADEIIKKIEERAGAEVEKILQEANRRRDEILEEAREEAERRKQAILEKGEKDAILEKQRIIADAKLKARRLRWEAQEELITRVFDAAKGEIEKVRSDSRYNDILTGLIKEGIQSIGADEVEVLLPDGVSLDLDSIAAELGVKIIPSEERVAGMGGVIVRTRDGKIEVNNTFERRMERFLEDLRGEVTTTLFGGA
ncbi:MAG: hypothetical protein DRG69_09925 [Deltaproteobacteria bacterium]|nr:MAG: hypothetical protein DRG69_09925 [Deltaproteobacteria bacterium]